MADRQPMSSNFNFPRMHIGETQPVVLADKALVAKCKHRLDAIRLCVQLSSLSNDTICDRLGIDPGHFSRMMQGRANFPDSKSLDLMAVCGNYAPLQFEATRCGFRLVEESVFRGLVEEAA